MPELGTYGSLGGDGQQWLSLPGSGQFKAALVLLAQKRATLNCR